MGLIARFARRTAVRFIPRLARTLQCSGCGQRRTERVRFIAGPRVYLCSDCFAIAARQLTPRRPPTGSVRCQFCRALRPPLDVTRVGPVTVCAECLALMDEILAAAPQAGDNTSA